MGYTTNFTGSIAISPPLNAEETKYLTSFVDSRRYDRVEGPYAIEGVADRDSSASGYNKAAEGQPGLWCQWIPNEDGTELEWDGGEKFYESEAWMRYLIEHFLQPGAHAAAQLPFLQANHTLNGTITAQGEEPEDRWLLIVTNNTVERREISDVSGSMSAAELSTVLAALRYYQHYGEQTNPACRLPDIEAIATNEGTVEALDDAGVDALCERLNTVNRDN